MSASIPEVVGPLDIFRVDPPTVEVSEDGIKIAIIAEYIDDEHERAPYGMVITAPTESTIDRSKYPLANPKSGWTVIGLIGKGTVFSEQISDKRSLGKRSPETKLQKAEKRATETILGQLSLK